MDLLRLQNGADSRCKADTRSRRILLSAICLGVLGSGGVMAETLAQPAGSDLERKAADYVSYRTDVATVEATPFNSAKTTREAHKLLSTHESKELSTGWVAYAALVAADTPEFAEALEKELTAKGKGKGKKGMSGKDAFLARLNDNPDYVMRMPGAQAAIQRVLATTAQDARRFAALGEAFKQQAYAMQRTAWGKSKIPAGSQRNAEAANYGASRPEVASPAMQPVTNGGVTAPQLTSLDQAWSPSWGASAKGPASLEPNASVVMNRVMTLAARYGVGGVNTAVVDAYAKNDRADQCLSMAKLTLKQCIAATRAPYEEAFCLGEHALNDTSRCIGWVAEAGPQGS